MGKIKLIGKTKKYPIKVQIENLPSKLEKFRHSIPWPITVEETKFHLACYSDDTNYSDPRIKYMHDGIDIQAPAGTEVRLPERCKLIFCISHADNYLTNMLLWSEQSKLEYYFVHLDPELIPKSILAQKEYNPDKLLQIEANEVIGKIGIWPLELSDLVKVPADVLPVFGRKFHHLHFEIRYVPPKVSKNLEYYDISVCAPVINPLLLLKRLQ